ncbi:unnamed protein product [Ectocarpus sp. 6 AP-2014]
MAPLVVWCSRRKPPQRRKRPKRSQQSTQPVVLLCPISGRSTCMSAWEGLLCSRDMRMFRKSALFAAFWRRKCALRLTGKGQRSSPSRENSRRFQFVRRLSRVKRVAYSFALLPVAFAASQSVGCVWCMVFAVLCD